LKKKILIISGGYSKERQISLQTGIQVAKELKNNGYKIKICEPNYNLFSLVKKFKEKLDPRKFNGAIFLGLNGPVVKSHGSTDSIGFYHSIDLCYNIVKGNLMSQIKDNLSHLNDNKV